MRQVGSGRRRPIPGEPGRSGTKTWLEGHAEAGESRSVHSSPSGSPGGRGWTRSGEHQLPGIGGSGLHPATGQLCHGIRDHLRARRGRRLGTHGRTPTATPAAPLHLIGRRRITGTGQNPSRAADLAPAGPRGTFLGAAGWSQDSATFGPGAGDPGPGAGDPGAAAGLLLALREMAWCCQPPCCTLQTQRLRTRGARFPACGAGSELTCSGP